MAGSNSTYSDSGEQAPESQDHRGSLGLERSDYYQDQASQRRFFPAKRWNGSSQLDS